MTGDDPRLAQFGQFTPEGTLTPGFGDHYLFLVGRAGRAGVRSVRCQEEGCGGQAIARGWCVRHYARWRRLGTTELPASVRPRNYSGRPVAPGDPRLERLRASARQHRAVQRKYGPARDYNCTFCYGRQAGEWAWQHGSDPDDTFSYVPLCRVCHTAYDHEVKSALASVHNRNRDQSAIAARTNERRWGKHDG